MATRKTPVAAVSIADFAFRVPPQAVGASLVYFDLYNASLFSLWLREMDAIKDGTAAVTGALAVALLLTRTSAIGTGGTLAAAEETDVTKAGIARMDPGRSLPSGVTMRLTPTGGATAGVMITSRQLFTEETTGVNYEPLNMLPPGVFIIPPSSGIRVVQSSVASVGNIGFGGAFSQIAG